MMRRAGGEYKELDLCKWSIYVTYSVIVKGGSCNSLSFSLGVYSVAPCLLRFIFFSSRISCGRFRRVGKFNDCWFGTVCHVTYSVFYWPRKVEERDDEVGGDQ